MDEAVPTRTARSRSRLRGGLVTVGTVLALLAAMGLTVLGLGAADNAVASYDASSWLWSAARSELARVNGVTARVDTRMEVPAARRHPMQVVQTDRLLMLRDLNTGQISALDLATLQITATTPTTPGLGVSVALHEDAAFVVDAVQGVVRQLDPRSLAPVGEPVRYPPGITGGAFDGTGRLWIAVPAEGTVSAITPAALPSAPADGGQVGPPQVETYDVAETSHELVISTLDDGVAVLDRTAGALVTVVRGTTRRTALASTLTGPGIMPVRTSGPVVPVTVPGQRQVHAIGDGGEVRSFTVPGDGDRLGPAVAWAGRFYCADEAAGTVYAFDAAGQLTDTIRGRWGGPLELEVRENHLFINAPDAATARVVNDSHQVREVDKYANDVLGGDPPPAPPPPPPPPKKPEVSRPGAPRSVTAAAGDAQARVSWRPAAANGAAIVRYVVEGAGQRLEVGANQRSVEVKELTNGETYRFSVHAVNAKGAGPARNSNPVTPTAEVPDAPTSVTAEARADGTVVVSWPAANGQGNTIARYAVTATSAGTNAPAGEATGTELLIKSGELEYGTQYAFTVVSVNDKGAASEASPVSNTVVPFTVPGEPVELRASTVADRPGTVAVQWAPAPANGRPVSGYVVDVGGRRSEVTDTQATVDGLGDGQNVTVRVRAVNEAGEGPEATTTARTVAPPRVTVTGSSATATAATVTFTVDAGGGQATCTLTRSGQPARSGPCSSITMSGLTPGTGYTFTVTATNAAGTGTATRAQTTNALYGVATCNNGPEGDQRTYCDRDVAGRNGNEIFSVARQDNDRQVGWAKPGTRLKAFCKQRGEEVYAYIYNNEKRSTWWVQVDYSGKNYIPWAWLNLEGGDDINVLPTC
ncbi:fibronectin type III domain-containing protein [Micromonospora sp. WMMD1082]|uniref:fibronectin type III domain-containing protein n=1 Tax=Micromonospora sp. WMMD1082 TaxID=3016104 RepID=UPI002416613E|nr:fibronectin type III domain-containing protein [Micromonospora sp. WMMD1082]MDG4796852.1 fibronectin type III domain-containing protein [Micromonospora sp. WMMD1082]